MMEMIDGRGRRADAISMRAVRVAQTRLSPTSSVVLIFRSAHTISLSIVIRKTIENK